MLPDGSIAQVKIDFETLRVLSELVRKEYGLSGCVQHGASTLPEEAFDKFPETGTSEIHLATGFQNIIYDSKYLPDDFRKMIYEFLKKNNLPLNGRKDRQRNSSSTAHVKKRVWSF